MVRAEQIKAERDIFSSSWNMLKQYYDADTTEDWKRLQSDVYALMKHYRGTEHEALAKDIALAVLDHIDRHEQRKRGLENVV